MSCVDTFVMRPAPVCSADEETLSGVVRLHDLVGVREDLRVGDPGERLGAAVERLDEVRRAALLPGRGRAAGQPRYAERGHRGGAVVGARHPDDVVDHRARVGPEPQGPPHRHAALAVPGYRDAAGGPSAASVRMA